MRGSRLLAVCAGIVLALPVAAQSNGPREMTVAQDGSGTFKSVQEAVNAAPTGDLRHPTVIHVKPGVYRERVYVQREKRFLRLVGEDAGRTVIGYDLNANLPGPDGKPIGTFRTPTVQIDGDDVTVERLTLRNSAGNVGQALALRMDGDRVVFRHCRFLGWQDTILVNRGRQLFQDCYIEGAVDFIFGAATAYFDRCHIYCSGNGYITAASTPLEQPYGIIFSHCRIDGAAGVKTYLGRPWRDYAQTVFLNCEMSEVVRPEGWSNWHGTERTKTARYAEFHNTGPGADLKSRAPWAKQLTPEQAKELTLERVVAGTDRWNPRTGAVRVAPIMRSLSP